MSGILFLIARPWCCIRLLGPVVFVIGVCLTIAGCSVPSKSLDGLPLLGNRTDSKASLSKVVKNDPFPTAAQAGLCGYSIGKKNTQ